MFAEAKAANPAYRDSNLVEVEALVGWIAGDFTAALAMAREAVAWLPAATARRRAPGSIYGAVSAIETGDRPRSRAFSGARAGHARRAGMVLLPRRSCTGPTAILVWYTRGAAECVAPLRAAAAQLLGMEVRTIAAFALFDLAEAAADAGDARAAARSRGGSRGGGSSSSGCRGTGGWPRRDRRGRASPAASPSERRDRRRQAIELLSGDGLDGRMPLGVITRSVGRCPLTRAARRWPRSSGPRRSSSECGSAWRRDRCLEAMRRLGAAGRRAAAAALGPELVDPPRARGRPPRRDRDEREGDRAVAVRRQAHRRDPSRQRVREARRGFQAAAGAPRRRSSGSREPNP